MPFSFSFFSFFFFLFFVFHLPFVVLRVPFPFPFCRFPFVSCTKYRLLRFSFHFPAFLGGRFCYSAISFRRYAPPALLATLKYAYEVFPIACCLLSCVLDVDLPRFPFSLSGLASLRFRFGYRFILSFSFRYYAVSSVSVSAVTRLAYLYYVYLDTYHTYADSPLHFCLRYQVYDLFELLCVHDLQFFIRAKRVSNCYMREKKTDSLCVCVYVRQIAKTRHTFACLHTWFLKTHTHIATVASTHAHRNCGQPNGGRTCCLMHGVAHE